MLPEDQPRNLSGEVTIETGDAQVEISEPDENFDDLTPIEQTDFLLRKKIEQGSRETIVALFSFTDLPDEFLVYITTDVTRSLEVLDEEKAFGRVGLYENLAAQNESAPCQTHLITLESSSKFVPVAKKAIEDSGTRPQNTEYLLGILDSLQES